MNTFSESERGGAIGSWTAWGAIAGVLGPLVAGELLAIGSWRLIFLINIPLAAICVALILLAVPEAAPRERGARRVDLPGALLCAGGLGGSVFALIEQPRLGWSSPAVAIPLIGGIVLLGCFLFYEARAPDPMLPLGLFRRRNFSAGNIETFSMYAGLSILFFFLVLFLQQIGGYTPLQSGLATLPVTVVMFVLSRRFGALADRFGPRLFMGGGPLVAAVRPAAAPARDPEGRLRLRSAARAARVRARAVDDRRAADRGGAGRGGQGAVGHRLGREQRDRARGGAARHGGARARSWRPPSARRSRAAWRAATLAASARAALAQAKRLPLGRPDVHGLPAAQARALAQRRRTGLAAQLPPGDGDRRGARRRRRGDRGGGDSQPRQAGARRVLPGRPARRGERRARSAPSAARGALEAQPTGSRA